MPSPYPSPLTLTLTLALALALTLTLTQAQCDEARASQTALTKKVDEAKATLRAQQDSGDAMREDFEGGMDYDDDKTRKSGRAKLKHAHGAGSRR